jgi:hypothetical protein
MQRLQLMGLSNALGCLGSVGAATSFVAAAEPH